MISPSMWSKSKKGKCEVNVRTKFGGLIAEEKQKINEFWHSEPVVRVSPHETHVIKRKSKNNPVSEVNSVYYRKHSIKETFELFKKKHPNIKCENTTFFNLKPDWIKKARGKFDVCPICKQIKHERPKLLAKKNLTTEEIKWLEAMNHHEKVVKIRTKEYDNSIKI